MPIEDVGGSARVCVCAVNAERDRLVDALRRGGVQYVVVLERAPMLLDQEVGALTVAVLSTDVLDPTQADDVRAVARGREDLAVLIVAQEGSDRVIRRAVQLGAAGVVLSKSIDSTIALAVQAAHVGLSCFPRHLAGHAAKPVLTTREKQVLGMIVLGMSNAEIAGRLHVTESTVKSHLSVTFAKLGVRTRSEAAAAVIDPVEGFGPGILRIPT